MAGHGNARAPNALYFWSEILFTQVLYPFEAIFNDFEQDNVDQFLRNSLSGGCFWPFSTSKVCFRG